MEGTKVYSVQSEISKLLLSLRSGRGTVIDLTSKDKELRGIGQRMSMVLDTKISVWGSQYCLHFHLCFTMILFYKMRRMLIQNVAFTLLQNMIKVHYKMVWFFISKCNSLITKWGSHQKMRHSYSKCDIYYKMWRFLQNTLLLKGISVFHGR